MATTSRFSRDMGHENTMTDKKYRELVKQDVHFINHNVHYLAHIYYHRSTRHHHRTWLQLMGLMETWNIKA